MKALPAHPSLYQINTRVWLTELSRTLGKAVTLDDIPDAELDRLAQMGFDWIWFLSVWQTGTAAQRVSRSNAEWRKEFQETLPDLREEDIAGSGFAITGYTVHPGLGGDAALARLRERLRKRGLRLMLDFVPNHMAPDHPWVERAPGLLCPRQRQRSGKCTAELLPSGNVARVAGARLWPGPVLRRMARYPPARLQQSRHAGGDDRRAAEGRRPV